MAIYKRKKKSGIKSNQDKLRLSVFRSHLNMYLQMKAIPNLVIRKKHLTQGSKMQILIFFCLQM